MQPITKHRVAARQVPECNEPHRASQRSLNLYCLFLTYCIQGRLVSTSILQKEEAFLSPEKGALGRRRGPTTERGNGLGMQSHVWNVLSVPAKCMSKCRCHEVPSPLRRWHPDKFVAKFGSRLAAEDRERILMRVKETSQALNALA
jgi:hypothetical protein